MSDHIVAREDSKLHHHHPDYPTTADDYELLSEIGRGAFAIVYRARLKSRDEEVAVKILDLEELNVNWEEIRKEISIMRQMQHPNVVPIKCAFVEGEELWIVMPLLAGGSCANIMKKLYPNGIKDEPVIAYILMEVLKGLEYFHKDGKIHRDVKAGNILLSGHGEVQLADFGVAGTLMENGHRKKNRQTFVGTPCWMAPEVMEQSNGYDYKADIWSFGITAMELAYGRAPYATYQPMKVLLMTLQEDPPTCDIYKDNTYKFSKNFHELVAKCLRKDISRRPTADKLMKHKFFDHIASREEVIVKLITPLPPPPAVGDGPVLRKKKKQEDIIAHKPISVDSWIFEDRNALQQEVERMESSGAVHDANMPVIINFGVRPPSYATRPPITDDSSQVVNDGDTIAAPSNTLRINTGSDSAHAAGAAASTDTESADSADRSKSNESTTPLSPISPVNSNDAHAPPSVSQTSSDTSSAGHAVPDPQLHLLQQVQLLQQQIQNSLPSALSAQVQQQLQQTAQLLQHTALAPAPAVVASTTVPVTVTLQPVPNTAAPVSQPPPVVAPVPTQPPVVVAPAAAGNVTSTGFVQPTVQIPAPSHSHQNSQPAMSGMVSPPLSSNTLKKGRFTVSVEEPAKPPQ